MTAIIPLRERVIAPAHAHLGSPSHCGVRSITPGPVAGSLIPP